MLHVLILMNKGIWIFCIDLFLQMLEFLRQSTLINLKPNFDFVFRV